MPLVGDAEKYLMRHKGALQATLKQLLSRKNVKTVKQLIALDEVPGQSSHFHINILWILHTIGLMHCDAVISCHIVCERFF